VGLTQAILTGLGMSVAVMLPLVFKGSGLFKDAPNLLSPAGFCMLAGVGVMLIAVVLASLAGFGRDRELKQVRQTTGGFLGGLVMVIVAGVTSAGIFLAFVYSQGPIIGRVSTLHAGGDVKLVVTGQKSLTGSYSIARDGTIRLEKLGAVKVAGLSAKAAADKIASLLKLRQQPEADAMVRAETADVMAVFPVWAVGLCGGALINIIYPIWLLTRNRSWGVFAGNWREAALSVFMGIEFIVALVLLGKGMVLLGVLGASVGAGIQQAMQMVGAQGVGFISGEWQDVYGRPRRLMYMAIAMLIIATIIMAYGNTLS
jgi:hypothetical protein